MTSREEVKPPTERTIGVTPDTVNPTLDAYRQERGSPYSNEYFGLDTPFDYLPTEMQGKLQVLDSYIEQEIANRHLNPNVRNYNKIMDDLKMELVSDDEINTADQIDRLSAYARNMLKLSGIDDLRDELTNKLKRLKRGRDMDNLVLKRIGERIL